MPATIAPCRKTSNDHLDERGRDNRLLCAPLWLRLMSLTSVLQRRPFPLGLRIVPRLPRLLFLARVARIVSRQATFEFEKATHGLGAERAFFVEQGCLALDSYALFVRRCARCPNTINTEPMWVECLAYVFKRGSETQQDDAKRHYAYRVFVGAERSG